MSTIRAFRNALLFSVVLLAGCQRRRPDRWPRSSMAMRSLSRK